MKPFGHLLVAVDTRLERHTAWEQAVAVARCTGARITLVEVIPELSWPKQWRSTDLEAVRRAWLKDKEAQLEKLAQEARAQGLDVTTRIQVGNTSTELVRLAEELECDTVFLASKGQHSRRTGSLGTTAQRLLRLCPARVWLVVPDVGTARRRLAAAVDAGTADPAHEALNRDILEVSSRLAEWLGAELHVAYAFTLFGESLLRSHMPEREFVELFRSFQEDQTRALNRLLDQIPQKPASTTQHLLHGDARDVLPQFVAEQKN